MTVVVCLLAGMRPRDLCIQTKWSKQTASDVTALEVSAVEVVSPNFAQTKYLSVDTRATVSVACHTLIRETVITVSSTPSLSPPPPR